MQILEFEIKNHLETIDFILKQSKVDYPQLEKYEKQYKFLKKNLYEIYQYMKNLQYIKGDNKSQLIATPDRLYQGKAPYQNCAVKVYLFVCLLRYLKKKDHPLTKNKFYIEISGKTENFKDIGHIYIKTKLSREIRYFDFTYPNRNYMFLPLYIPKISIAREIEL